MTSSFVPPRLAAEVTSLLSQLGVAEAAWRSGTLAVRSPINGEAIGQVVESRPEDISQGIADAHRACLAWRTVPAPRRGELVRLLGEELARCTRAPWAGWCPSRSARSPAKAWAKCRR